MNKLSFLFITLLTGIFLSGCLKKDFDTPPDLSGYDPGLPVTHDIARLKNLNGPYAFLTGGDTTLITEDIVIQAVVTADDRSGNFYKAMNIQDSSGGIQLLVDAFSLHLNYPVGRKIYVRCKGLTLGYNGGTPVLGYGVNEQMEVQAIPGGKIAEHIVKANVGYDVKPDTVTMSEITGATLDRSLVNKLIYIPDVEFIDSVGDKSYAQPNGTTNRDFKDCAGKVATVRTSNFSDFAMMKLPTGKGSITGVFSIFISSTTGRVSPQLTIRDTTDVKLYGRRCSGGSGGGGGSKTLLSENFNSGTNNTDIALAGWTNFAEAGSKKFQFSNAGASSNYARISAFSTNQPAVTAWLVTPGINLTGAVNPVLTFRSANGFDNGATLKVYASTNFNGSNFNTATWTQLNPTLAPSSASGFSSFVSSGNVSLSAFSGTVYIAFKYEGADPSGTGSDKTTTWEIDEVKVVGE